MRFHAVLVIDLGLVALALVALVAWLRDRSDATRRALLIGLTLLAGAGMWVLVADLAGIIRLPRPGDAPPPLVLPATSPTAEAPPAAPPVIAPRTTQKDLRGAGEHHREALERFERDDKTTAPR